MNTKEYERIHEKLTGFRCHSMNYIEYEDMKDFEIIREDSELILVAGWDSESGMIQTHWAANSVDELAAGLRLLRSSRQSEMFKLSFVPKEWVERLKKEGYEIYAIWHDFWIHNIQECLISQKETEIGHYECLTERECEEAANVTVSCRGQSRGFTGQSPQWMKEWLNGTKESAVDSDAKDSAVLVQRNSLGKIIGVLCTTIYGHNSKDGPICWIRELAVMPEYQRHGFGRKLILQALNYGTEKSASRAFLGADENNQNAINLYRSIGFVPSEEDGEINMVSL